jgi:predicted outer membrane repeat protein
MHALVVLLILWSGWPNVTAAATRVNVCHHDLVVSPGLMNLSHALSIGGDITIDCPEGSVLRVTGSYSISRNISIDGHGVTLLIETTALPAFSVGAGARLRLRDLTLRSTGSVPTGRSPGLSTFLVGRRATLELERVTARGLARPAFVMEEGKGVIVGGSFAHGRDPIRVEGGHIDISGGTTFDQWATALQVFRGTVAVAGAMFRRSRLVMDRCKFSIADSEFLDSDVRSDGLSGGAIDTDCSGRIDRSLFVNNHAVDGGAINLRSLTNVALFRVRFFHNSATGNGGTIHRRKYLSLRSQPAPPISLAYCVFRANSAENGGAVYLPNGVVEARVVHFAQNIARHTGGGFYGRSLRMTRGTFVGNSAGVRGGGIYSLVEQHPSPDLVTNVVVNSLLVKNSAPDGAGIYGSAMRVINVTIADNTGPGISAGSARVRPAAINLTNTLLTANSGGNCAPASGADGVIDADGPNLEFPSSSCPGATVADPTLDPLYSPVVGSPALAAADLHICISDPVLSRDVYGEPRPQGKGCTIGAVENAVDRLVFSRLLRECQEVPEHLLDKIREVVKRLWDEK